MGGKTENEKGIKSWKSDQGQERGQQCSQGDSKRLRLKVTGLGAGLESDAHTGGKYVGLLKNRTNNVLSDRYNWMEDLIGNVFKHMGKNHQEKLNK